MTPESKSGILKASGFLLVLTLAGRLLSMVREMLLAQRIGMNAYTDAFNVSQSAITFCTAAIGATCLALVPILVSAGKDGERRRDEVFTSLFALYMIVSVVVALLLSFFAEPVCRVLGPSMSKESQQIAAELLRIGFVKVNCVVGGTLFAYYLQSREVFVVSGLAALLSSAVVVVLLLTNPQAGIYDYTTYTVFGFVAQILTPIPFLLRVRYRPRIKRLIEKRVFKALLLASVPLMASAMFFQFQTLVGRAIATGFGEGAASSVDYANKLIQLVYASITMSLNSVLFTHIAQAASSSDSPKAARLLMSGGRNQLLLLMPLVLIALFFGRPLIALLFERGAFTSEDTAAVYAVLLGYLLGAWPYVISDLFSKYYVSLKRYKTINVINGVGYGASLIVVYPIAVLLGAPGVSVAFSIAQIVILVGFALCFAKDMAGRGLGQYLNELIKIKEFLPSAVLLVGLLVWTTFFGEPTPVVALLLAAGFFAFYCVLLLAFKIRIGFRNVE